MNVEQEMSRAVIYTRVSTDKQEADGDSLDVQERDCRADCERSGDTVVGVCSDTFTGHDSMDERRGMWDAIKMIQRGEADTLVIKRISRSNRDITDNLILFRHICEAGGHLRAAVEGPIPNTPFGKVMLTLHSFQAEQDWENIRQQTQQGIRSRVNRGRPLTSVPLFGYHYVDGNRHQEKYATKMALVPDEESAPIVQVIFEKADAAWDLRRIAKWLNDHGMVTPSQLLYVRGDLGNRKLATAWSAQMVYDILTNESYCGRHAAFRHTFIRVKRDGVTQRLRRARTEGTTAMSIPALVDEATWERVNANLKDHRLWGPAKDDEPLLNKGFAICGVCGARMIAARHHRGQYRLYVCSRRRGVEVRNPCPGGAYAVRASEVDADIWGRVEAIIRDRPRFQRLTQSKTAKLAQEVQEAAERAEAVARELAEMQEKQATVYERMTYEQDETIRAMHRAELVRLNQTVTELEARASETRDYADKGEMLLDGYKQLLVDVAARIATTRSDPEEGARWRAAVATITSDPAASDAILDRIVPGLDGLLDGFTREDKRGILRLLDVTVPMFPVAVKVPTVHKLPTDGKRWGFRFTDGVLSQESSS